MSERESKRADQAESPSPAPPAPELAPPAPAFTPLAGLARAVEGVQDDVMGGQAVPDAVSTAIRRRHGRGRPLPSGVAGDLGDRLGTDFSGVRVHADAEADTIARSVQAKAFTLGSEIYFSKGTYAPESSSGRSLLAHELTHVRQHQQGGGSSGGALSVGTVHDPAEKEAEHVARQVENGGRVPGGSGASAGAVRRSPSTGGTIRRLFGVAGLSAIGQGKEGEIKTEDEDVPTAFVELADTIQAAGGIPQAMNEGASGMGIWGETNSFGDTDGGGGTAIGLQGVSAIKQVVGGSMTIHEGRHHLEEGRANNDSLSKNLGATKIEAGTWTLLSGGGSGGGLAQTSAKLAGENIPIIDVVTNTADAINKGKKSVEDATASAKLGNQKVKAKREADQFLPYEVRHDRFKTFLADLKADKFLGPLKRDDKKRWPKVKTEWFAGAAGRGATYAATEGEADTTKFNPTNAEHWVDANAMRTEKTAFLAFLVTQGKDFGRGTEARDGYDQKVKDGTEQASEEYSDLRNMKKVGKFGQVRKADTATTNAIEAAGSTLDAVGTATAAGDLGATKITGKILKGLSALYKGVKSLVKRARRVHKLRKAKNDMKYGDRDNRGFIWGMQQFFAGNVSVQQEHAKEALADALAKDKKYKADLLQAQSDQTQWDSDQDKYDQYMLDKKKWDDDQDAYDQEYATYLTEKAEYDKARQEHAERKKAYDTVFAAYQKALAEKAQFMASTVVNPARSGKNQKKFAEHLWQQSGSPEPQAPTEQDPGKFQQQRPKKPTGPGAAPTVVNAPSGARPQNAVRGDARSTSGKKATLHDATTGDIDPKRHKALMKQLTIQCDRKIEQMLGALASKNAKVRHRAQAIMHVIAETNLAGAIEKLEKADLDRFGDLYDQERAGTLAPADEPELNRRRAAITGIIKHQLSGIGG